MTINKKSVLRIALFFAVIVIACAVVLYFAVTPVLNTEQVKTRLTQMLQEKTGIDFQFNQLAVTLTPLPGVSMTGISAQINPKTRVTINKALVELAPVQLLKFKTAVRRITLQSPELAGIMAFAGQNGTSDPPNLTAFLKNGFDSLLDIPFADKEHLDLIITNARSDYFGTMDCRVQMTPRTRAITIAAQISELGLKTDRIPKLESVLKGRITEFKTPHLSFVCRHDKNTLLAGNLELTSLQARLQSPTDHSIDARHFDLQFDLSKEKITALLSPLELVYPKGQVGIDISLSLGQDSSILEFTGKQIDIGQARQVCLPLLDGIETSEILFDILRAGSAQKVTVGFKSKGLKDLFKTKALFIEGSSNSATVKIPTVPVIVHNAAGRAEMKEGVLRIHPEGGHVGKTHVTGGNLDINLNHHHIVPFSGKFPLKIDLSELPATLSSLLPDTALAREMARISNLTGRADADLELNYTQAHKDLDVKVTANNLQAKGTYQRIPLPMRITGGTFAFDKGNVTLKNISGALGKSKISNLNAGIDTSGSVPMHIKSMAANIVLAQTAPLGDLFPEARKKLGLVQNVSGTMKIGELRVEGPMFSPALWQGQVTGQINDAAVIFQNNTKGISDLFCNVTYNFAPTSEAIMLSDIKSTVTDLSWLEKAMSPDYIQSIVLPLTFTQAQFVKQPDHCLFQGQLFTTSGTRVSFTADGLALDNMTPSKIQIVDGNRTHAEVIFYKQPNMPRMDFSGKLDKSTLEKMFSPDSYLYKKLQAVTGDTPFTVSTDTRDSIRITADTLNIDPLLASQKNIPADTRPLLKQKQIFLNIDTLGHDQRVYQQVKAKVTLDHPGIDMEISHALFCNLDLSGQITINDAGDTPKVSTHILLKAGQEKEVALSIGCLTGSESVIEGSYTLGGELSGVARTLTQVQAKQNGHLEFRAQSGRIYKATLLSRLLSMLNILGDTDLQQQGFGFKTFTADAEVKDSVVHIKKAFIDADNMAIIAEGWADPLNDALDITFLVAPFKTIDTIIKHIPIVNIILNDRLVSLPARAYGKISDPTVIPLHPSAVGKGLLTLLGDLIKTPGRFIDRIKDNEK